MISDFHPIPFPSPQTTHEKSAANLNLLKYFQTPLEGSEGGSGVPACTVTACKKTPHSNFLRLQQQIIRGAKRCFPLERTWWQGSLTDCSSRFFPSLAQPLPHHEPCPCHHGDVHLQSLSLSSLSLVPISLNCGEGHVSTDEDPGALWSLPALLPVTSPCTGILSCRAPSPPRL